MDIVRLREYLHRLDMALAKLRFARDIASPELRQEGEDLLEEGSALRDALGEKAGTTVAEAREDFSGLYPDVLVHKLLRVIAQEEYYRNELTRPFDELLGYLEAYQEVFERIERDLSSKGSA